MPHRLVLSLVLAGIVAMTVPGAAMARTLVVGDGGPGCRDARYATIQTAVDAARPGDQIPVCPGRYTESVGVTQQRLKIFSRKRHAAVVEVGASGVGFALDATSTLVRGFTVVPPDVSCTPFGSGTALSAIGVGTFEDNRVKGEGCRRFGDGVVSFSSDSPGSLNIVGNEFSGFVNRGVFADSRRVTINRNTVRGGRVGFVILQGDMVVQGNVVEDADEYGILGDGLERSRFNLWLAGNRLRGNRDGIVVQNLGGGVFGPVRLGLRIQTNTVLDSVRDGIKVLDAGFGLVTRNRSLGSGRFDCVSEFNGITWKDNIGRTDSPSNLCRAP